MVLGQDFDKVEGFADSLKRGEEERAVATWGNLLPLLDSCRLPLAACFFTNAYVGLRKSDINYGPGAGTRSPAFRASCEQFFVQQLAAQQPKLILALGLEVALFLSRCSPNFAAWRVDTLKTIDSSGAALIEGAQVGPHTIAATVVLVHPSFRPANVGRRRFRGAVGETAEQLLICTGAGIAGGFSDFCRLTPACRGDAPRAARA
jgi:hypothetical protein